MSPELNKLLSDRPRTEDIAARHDVVILGSGLGGSTLATILARQGLKTLLLERGRHPRFALGESIVPEFSFRAKLLAACFDVPELAHMGGFRQLTRNVSSRTGIKRNFTFLHHREGQLHSAGDVCQFQAMTYPLGPDAHVYRADLDEWLTALAVKYGADYREQVSVDSVETDAAGVTVAAGNSRFRAGFVIDATGRSGVLATQARDADVDLQTNTRTMFTHMIGVKDTRSCHGRRLGVPSPSDQGTLHHVFDGGWFWVIPFGNHRGSTTELTSVGLTLDRRRFPENDLAAEEEFASFLRRFPSVAKQLGDGRPVRSWVKTGRVQHRSENLAGARCCLMPHASGFVDPLFSGGMAVTLSGVHEIATCLLRGSSDVDFTRVGQLASSNQRFLDRIVHGAYVSFRSYALFNAWYRIWAVANYHASLGLVRTWLKYRAGSTDALRDLDADCYRGVLASGQPRVRDLVDMGYDLLMACEKGGITETEAVDELFELLARQDWIPPSFRVTHRDRRHLASFSFVPMVATILWGKWRAPEDIRGAYYDVPANFFGEVGRFLGGEVWRGFGGVARNVRDVFWSRGIA